MATRRIGEFLVAEGVLTEPVLQRALGFQRVSSQRVKLGSILLHWDLLEEDALLTALSRIHRSPAVPWSVLAGAKIETVRLLPAAHAARLAALPYESEKGLVRVAFINPTDLAAVDEVGRITGRRVVAAVTTEVRMMQAQQRFYGRHVPLEFRAIIQKLDRRTAGVPRPPAPAPAGYPPPAAAAPASSGISIPVERGPAEDAPPEIDPIVLPDLPLPSPPAAARVEPIELLPAEDSLAAWVEEALSAFRNPAWNPSRPSTRVTPPTALAPAAPVRREPVNAPADPVADMWRSPGADAEAIASGMWTAPTPPRPARDAARTRDEVADAVIDSLLTDLPRAILLGVSREEIRGWRGKGRDLTPERVGALRIPLRDATVFSRVMATRRPHAGPVDEALWPDALADLLGSSPPDCAVFPIRIFDAVAAFLYADRLDQHLQYEDFAGLARAAASAARMLARFLKAAPAATP